MKIYPEFGDKVKKLKEHSLHQRSQINVMFTKLCQKYWRKLLDDNKYMEFVDLLNPSEKFITSCNFVINGEWIDCREIIYRIVSNGNYILELGLISSELNDIHNYSLLNEDIERNLDKITIELMRFETNLILMQSYESMFYDDRNFDTNVYYFSYSTNKLSNSEHECKETDIENSNFDTNDCMNECLINLNNKTHGCLELQDMETKIDVKKHLLNEGFRICPLNISFTDSFYMKIFSKCQRICPIGCKEIKFEKRVEFYRKLDNNTTTKRINFIPIRTEHIEYFEVLRTDFDQLIYTCAGIVGLWFGLSPNHISNFVLTVFHYLKSLVNYLIVVIHFFTKFLK